MFGWFVFSHHPLCKNYRKEIIEIKGIYLCKGCTEVYSSTFITILLVFALTSLQRLNVPLLLVIALLSILPSVIGNFYHFKLRIIKDFLRISLGIGLGLGLSQIYFLSDLGNKILAIIVIVVLYFIFSFTRSQLSAKHPVTLCPNCEQFNEQACANYRKVFNTEGEYSRIISDYIQKKLTINKIPPIRFENNFSEP